MKIIFLDIDGVLNYQRMTDAIETESGKVSKSAIELLNQLTDETDAKIVISSTWRKDSRRDCIESLKTAGVTGDIIGKTGTGCGCCLRGNEIRNWLRRNEKVLGCQEHEFKKYVILDDDSDMLLWQQDYFVLVDRFVGFTEQTLFKSKKVLLRYE
jgi:hypothetical protein